MFNTAFTLAGNIEAAPQLADTPPGRFKVTFRVLVLHRGRSGDAWVDIEPTAYHCEAWEELGRNLRDSVSAGDRVLVHGHVETETWTDHTGATRTRELVKVHDVGPSLARAIARPAAASPPRGD